MNVIYEWSLTYVAVSIVACQGDSGGPIVAFDSVTKIPTLLGIVSWGEGCAEPNYPGVYSKILAARTWIQEHTHI